MKPRWFDNQGAISIGRQNNGPEDHRLGVIKVDLGYLITRVSDALRRFAERLTRDGEKVEWPSLETEAMAAFGAFEQRACPKAVRRR